MPQELSDRVSERIRGLVRFLEESDAMRVRIERPGEEIEVARRPCASGVRPGASDRVVAETPPKLDPIRADLVGIFHLSRPAPLEGDVFDGDRELGYIEALGIRTPIHSMGAGRLVSVAAGDAAPVEYGQTLFLVARS
jgi:biotin carboxyl carrier protein